MRANIVIDDQLMADTLRTTGLRSKREAVELGLCTLLQLRQQPVQKRPAKSKDEPLTAAQCREHRKAARAGAMRLELDPRLAAAGITESDLRGD